VPKWEATQIIDQWGFEMQKMGNFGNLEDLCPIHIMLLVGIAEQIATHAVPSPTRPERTSAMVRITTFLFVILVILLAYDSWLEKSDFMRSAREQLIHDPRVRAEFGSDVSMPFALAWNVDGTPNIRGYVKGSQARGYAFLQMVHQPKGWTISHGEIHDTTEDHVLDLSPAIGVANVAQLHVRRRLYLVAVGISAHNEVQDLAKFLEQECGLRAQVLPDMQLPGLGFDAPRQQWIAEMLVDEMARTFPDIASDDDARIMGLIDSDIYPRSLGWDFTFNYRYANKYAVLQTTRLNPAFSRRKPNLAIMNERLRKTALKCLGLLYFDFQDSGRPDSVMSFEGTLQKIDRQTEHYLLSDLATRSASSDLPGKPCLSFSRVNVGGLSRLEPIHPYYAPYDISQVSYYQIDLVSGEFRTRRNDIYNSGPMPFSLHRLYASHTYDGKVRAFGKSTWQNLDDTVWSVDPQSIQEINIYGVEFKRITPGAGFSPEAKYRAPAEAGEFSGALLSWEGRWKIQTSTDVWHYRGCEPNSRIPCYFIDRIDPYGDRVAVERDNDGHIEGAIQNASGMPGAYNHTWTFTYDGDRIREIQDDQGRLTRYIYDAESYLREVEAGGHKLVYDYDQAHRMSAVTEDGHILAVHYDPEGRVVQIDFDSRPVYHIRYSGEIVEVQTPAENYVVAVRENFFHISRQE
jgi:YD repeat-containing protein